MPKKPVTMPRSVDLRLLSNPKTWKKVYLRYIFRGNKVAYEEYVRLYDNAVKNGSVHAVDMAWIEFNKSWIQNEEGEWLKVI